MKPLLITGWCGPMFAEMSAVTAPLMERYAARHGMDFKVVSLDEPGVPPSWAKIPRLAERLEAGCDAVLWLDADVVVVDSEADILADMRPDAWHAVVEHETACGLVPNCGVWVVRQPMLPILRDVWAGREKYLHHQWWEQAAVIERMGYAVTPVPTASPIGVTALFERTTFLPSKWNYHPQDSRRVNEPAFFHVTQYADRIAVAKEVASHAT